MADQPEMDGRRLYEEISQPFRYRVVSYGNDIVYIFLVVSFAVCIGLFAGAASDRKEAQRLNHIQELTLSVGEILEDATERRKLF